MLAIWKDASGIWLIAIRDTFLLLQRVFLETTSSILPRALKRPGRSPRCHSESNEPEAQWSSKSKPKTRLG